jgi:copper chaperone CopZ
MQVVLIGFYLCCMTKRNGFLTVSVAVLGILGMVSGCGDGASGVAVIEHFAEGAADHSVARLEVNGMMCAIACGGKIQKELLELDGVSNANIDFDAARELNFVEVEFSSDRVSPEEMAAKVNEIAGGIYQVNSVDVTHYALSANAH